MRWFNRKRKRRGLIEIEIEGAGLFNWGHTWMATCEVCEIEKIGRWSRVKVRKVAGIPRHYYRQVCALVAEWVPSTDVEWLEATE